MMTHRIMIADDATMNRMLIKKVLSQSLTDIEFFEAVNGQEVLDILDETHVDLIILDLIMPELDGYETLKILKSDPRLQDIPVIVNSAITEIESIEETLKVGAIDYFTKPLSPNDMKIILPLKAKNALLVYEQHKMIVDLNREINEELKNANTFANFMLPKANQFQGLDLFIKYHPSLGIGGDFFDCVEVDGRVHFMLADVTGHGIAAGMASSMVKVLYRKTIEQAGIEPKEVLEKINHSIFEIFDFKGSENYLAFTAFVGYIENGTMTYANAGQPYPMIYRNAEKKFQVIEQNGFLVGMLDGITYEQECIEVEKDDVIFLYTDGLFCAGNQGDFTAWETVFKLADQLKKAVKEPQYFLDEIFYAFHMIHHAKHSDFTDDVAMMMMRIK